MLANTSRIEFYSFDSNASLYTPLYLYDYVDEGTMVSAFSTDGKYLINIAGNLTFWLYASSGGTFVRNEYQLP
jgi:hypothetical protein